MSGGRYAGGGPNPPTFIGGGPDGPDGHMGRLASVVMISIDSGSAARGLAAGACAAGAWGRRFPALGGGGGGGGGGAAAIGGGAPWYCRNGAAYRESRAASSGRVRSPSMVSSSKS